jgi:hypothetical protein
MEIAMKKYCLIAAMLLVALLAPVSGQKTEAARVQQKGPQSTETPKTEQKGTEADQGPRTEQKAPQSKEDVVRISVTLVQVDAVVTDDKGRQVTDLKPEDFQILEDGRPQRITNFSYISNVGAPAQPGADAGRADKLAPPFPSRSLRPEEVKRTMALVVDDLSMSFETIAYTRYALKKYVDEQMQPGDLVAILRTGAGIGALQQFTNDKRQLYAAIERLHWNSMGMGGIGAFAPISSDALRGGG